MHETRGQIKALMVELYAGQRHCKIGAAMVAVGSRDNFLFVFLSQAIEIEMDNADCSVVRHRATGSVEHMVELAWRELCEFCCEFCSGRRRQMPEG